MPKLVREDIKVGAFIWYSGMTSVSGWNCPAVITKVDEEKQVFYVMSLDDMEEQSQPYDFELTKFSPTSRESMRLATLDEVDNYLGKQEEALIEKVSMTRRARVQSTLTLRRFRAVRDQLFPEHVKQ